MKIKIILMLFVGITTISQLANAARPSINALQTQVNQLGAEVNQIDARVSNLEALHAEVPFVAFGQVEFIDASNSKPVDLVSFSIGKVVNEDINISFSILDGALLAEIANTSVRGQSMGRVKLSFNSGGSLMLEDTLFNRVDYATSRAPELVGLVAVPSSYSMEHGACPSNIYVDLTNSTRSPLEDEVPVSDISFSVALPVQASGGGGSTLGRPVFSAGVVANHGELMSCVLDQAMSGLPIGNVRMERYLDAVSIGKPEFTVELTEALISSISVHSTSNGNIGTDISYGFTTIEWTSQDGSGITGYGGWDVLSNSPL